MNSPLHAVLFDLDGTLLDTAHTLLYAMNQALQQQQKPLSTHSEFRKHISGGIDAMVSHAFNIDHNHPDFEDVKTQCLDFYHHNTTQDLRFFEGMDMLLDALDTYDMPWGIVTNKSMRFTQLTLDAFNLRERAQCVVAGDTLEHMKPHPAPLLHACKLINCSPENTLYVGDFETDVVASKAAGIPCIIVTHGYYPDHTHPTHWGADLVVDQAQDILNYIKNSQETQHDNH